MQRLFPRRDFRQQADYYANPALQPKPSAAAELQRSAPRAAPKRPEIRQCDASAGLSVQMMLSSTKRWPLSRRLGANGERSSAP